MLTLRCYVHVSAAGSNCILSKWITYPLSQSIIALLLLPSINKFITFGLARRSRAGWVSLGRKQAETISVWCELRGNASCRTYQIFLCSVSRFSSGCKQKPFRVSEIKIGVWPFSIPVRGKHFYFLLKF
jgi:hypothetical protein